MHDFYEFDESLGFYGGGGIDGRHPSQGTPMEFALDAPNLFGTPSWGAEFKDNLAYQFSHCAAFDGHSTSLPLATNNVTLDPNYQDDFGRPAIRCTYMDHPDDLATMEWFMDKSIELMEAVGATNISASYPAEGQNGNVHLLGTCRMGNDPVTSVINSDHRAHDVPNLFMCDGSSLVTGGRGQPTMTIMALAFRAADRINQLAKNNSI